MNLESWLDLFYCVSCVLIFLGIGLGIYGIYRVYVLADTDELRWSGNLLIVACLVLIWGLCPFLGIKQHRADVQANTVCPVSK